MNFSSHQKYFTGYQRDTDEGKPDHTHLPLEALDQTALWYAHGARLHGRDNWRNGCPYSRLYASALRHLLKDAAGLRDEDHRAAAVFNLFSMMTQDVMIRDGRIPADVAERLQDMSWQRGMAWAFDPSRTREVKAEAQLLEPSLRFPGDPPFKPTPQQHGRAVVNALNEGGGTREARDTLRTLQVDEPEEPWLLYIAGKYSDERGAYYVDQNIRIAQDEAVKRIKEGFSVICPHTNTANMDGAVPYEEFIKRCLVQVRRCHAVVTLPNWTTSPGAKTEVEEALRKGIPVVESTVSESTLLARLHSRWGPSCPKFVQLPPLPRSQPSSTSSEPSSPGT